MFDNFFTFMDETRDSRNDPFFSLNYDCDAKAHCLTLSFRRQQFDTKNWRKKDDLKWKMMLLFPEWDPVRHEYWRFRFEHWDVIYFYQIDGMNIDFTMYGKSMEKLEIFVDSLL